MGVREDEIKVENGKCVRMVLALKRVAGRELCSHRNDLIVGRHSTRFLDCWLIS